MNSVEWRKSMAGSTYGDIFRITTWGESHGKGLGVVVDGCPAGIELDEETVQKYMDRRRPGGIKYSTPRKESDRIEIMSGVFEGRTTGTPISMLVINENHRSGDYSEIASYYRPGHADYTFDKKYGFRDYRGGGRSSGRETIGRVAGGAVALQFLNELGIEVTAYSKQIGPVVVNVDKFSKNDILSNDLYMPDEEAAKKAAEYLDEMKRNRDSAGGMVECIVTGMPAGLGEPVFDKLDAGLAKAIMSIGAVKGVEIGAGFRVSSMRGSENNDEYVMSDGCVSKLTNNSGGVTGGMSDGADIIVRAAFKPTPSIAAEQKTVNKNGENIDINIKGRHDPVIVPRAVVVVEAMTGITVADMLLKNMAANMDNVRRVYEK